jgi:hypothetical protein
MYGVSLIRRSRARPDVHSTPTVCGVSAPEGVLTQVRCVYGAVGPPGCGAHEPPR